MGHSPVPRHQRISDVRRPHSSRLSTNEHGDWIKDQSLQYEVKELAKITGLSDKAVMNLRRGFSAANSKTITEWARNCARFRAAYFAYCGGVLFGEPEMEAALTQLVNRFSRNGARP